MASKVTLSKDCVDGKRPGDEFTRHGGHYRVVRVYANASGHGRVVTYSNEYGREVWFNAPMPWEVPALDWS